VYQEQKCYEGTYATRMKFSDTPESGSDGDQLVQTFFTITPLDAPMDPDYGEIDFEYLPNGGWGEDNSALFYTTWETYQDDPWTAVNVHDVSRRSFNGWHDLVAQVSGGHVKYFVDGTQVADHSGTYYPETPMSMNFNTWFIDMASHAGGTSVYRQQIDYALHTVGEVLSPSEATARVNAYRTAGVTRTNTVGTGGGTCPAGPRPTATTPTAPSSSANLALNKPDKPVTVSSIEEGSSLAGGLAVDGDLSTRWASLEGRNDPEWITVDLGSTATLSRVVLKWEAAYAKAYRVELSADDQTWGAPVYSTTTGDGATDDLTIAGTGRYVRVYATQRGTPWGYSLFEFEVYGSTGQTTSPPSPGPTSNPTSTPTTPVPAPLSKTAAGTGELGPRGHSGRESEL
jgi:hypothetical protein